MTLQDLQFALELGCVMGKDIDAILEYSQENGIDTEKIDAMLEELGYDKVFENDFDDYDDDEYGYIEKFPHKNRFYED
ncbi:MAG: hypothetical protein RBR54_08000 [Sulfurimonas sp.]|jgi:hypothetical protein|nr:hypothetical protein [Sulfurimonas sp.]